MHFFKERAVTVDINNHLVHFPPLSLQLNHANGKFKCEIREKWDEPKKVVPRFNNFWILFARKIKKVFL